MWEKVNKGTILLIVCALIVGNFASFSVIAKNPDNNEIRGVPFIVSTTPVDGATGVAPDMWTYVVVWSESMNMMTGTVLIVPNPGSVFPVWSGGNSIFSFAANWAAYTHYTLTFSGFTSATGDPATGDLIKEFTTNGFPPFLQVDDLKATPHTNGGSDIQLEWTEVSGAISYNIYESLNVTGTGFNFASPTYTVPQEGDGKIIYQLSGKYADANSYCWVVRVVGAIGENTTDGGNIAWKLVYTLRKGTGMAGLDSNYISLPYRMNLTTNTAAGLISDMRAWGSPTNSVSSVNRWDQNLSLWQPRSAFAGTNWVIKPGEGYRIIATQSSVTYKIVGSHNPDYTNYLFQGTGLVGADSNYISLPYHYTFTTSYAAGLISSMRTTGTPTNSVSSVNRWNQDTSVWESRIAFAGVNFALRPGECYRVVVNQAQVTWKCPVRVPGA